MSKVAINGRTLPLAPIAGGLAGAIAFAAFLVMPQGILETLVWQTRMDMVLPAAQPPLGVTARILVAVVAALTAAALTAFFAVKFAKIGTKSTTRRRRRPLRNDGVEGVQPAISGYAAPESDSYHARIDQPRIDEPRIEAPVAPVPTAIPVATPVAPVEAAPVAEKKPSILDRLRRRKNSADVEVEETPRLRRRDFHPDAPARRPLFADVELPGKTLDSVNAPTEPARPPVTQSTTPVHERAHRQLPAWAYEEDCDLIGDRTPAEMPVARDDDSKSVNAIEHVDPISAWEAPISPVVAPAVDAQADDAVDGGARPNSAGMADWDDPSAFDNYIASLAEEEAVEEAGLDETSLEDADLEDGGANVTEEAITDHTTINPVVDASNEDERSVIDGPAVVEDANPHASLEVPAASNGAPLDTVPSAYDLTDTMPVQKIEAQLANTTVDDSSVDELMARLQEGMTRRAVRRAEQAEVARIAAAMPIAAPVEPTAAQESESGADKAEIGIEAATPPSDQADGEAAAPTNPFASIDPLANLADKEAEVDEALRAALSTLERMNRRVG